MLAELVRKREAQKQKQAQIINDLVSNVLFPHVPHLYNTLEKFEAYVTLPDLSSFLDFKTDLFLALIGLAISKILSQEQKSRIISTS